MEILLELTANGAASDHVATHLKCGNEPGVSEGNDEFTLVVVLAVPTSKGNSNGLPVCHQSRTPERPGLAASPSARQRSLDSDADLHTSAELPHFKRPAANALRWVSTPPARRVIS